MNTLDRLKELQAAATPGPWDRDGFYNVLRIAKKSLDWELVNPTEDTSMPDEDDAEFIVVLHEALPALLEVAEAAKELCRWDIPGTLRQYNEEFGTNFDEDDDAVKAAIRLDAALAKLEVEK